ncbi:hypothetical protein COCVIDRAFT_114369, partial [Bipolaris victoriae FI3]
SAYMLTCAASNPLYGKLYKLYDMKRTFLIAIVLFEVGSAMCGAAHTSTALVVGWAIAGVRGAGVSSGTMMVIVLLVSLRKRPIFIGLFAVSFSVSFVQGPFLGDTFTDNWLGWHWCFYINLPIDGCAFAVALIFLHIQSPPKTDLPIFFQIKHSDPIGLLFFRPSMVCLISPLEWVCTMESWSSPEIIGLVLTFAVMFLVFLANSSSPYFYGHQHADSGVG